MVVIPGTAASPKSISTGPSGPSRTLPGLKSRCTIPAACTAPSAVSVATAMRSSAAPPRGPSCSTTSTSDGPLTYSLTMNGRRSKIPASRTWAVQNRATRCAAATSFRKRLRTCGSVVGGRSLTAAWLPAGPTAKNTTPCPPSPRRPSNRYTPTWRGSVSRSASISGIVDQADVTRPFCPGGSAYATIPFRQFPAAAFPAARLRFRGIAVSLLRPPAPRSGSPHGKMMLSAENIGNFPLNALRPGHAVGEARPQDAPGAGSEPGQGRGPGSTVSPPRCPGPRSASGAGRHRRDQPRYSLMSHEPLRHHIPQKTHQ